ncbi:MAG TPA: hypothetical protein VIK38_04220, partial [Coriobacteriia bacterium]
MRRLAPLFALLALALMVVAGCAPASTQAPATSGSAETTRGAEAFIMVGKTKLYLDGGPVYNP